MRLTIFILNDILSPPAKRILEKESGVKKKVASHGFSWVSRNRVCH